MWCRLRLYPWRLSLPAPRELKRDPRHVSDAWRRAFPHFPKAAGLIDFGLHVLRCIFELEIPIPGIVQTLRPWPDDGLAVRMGCPCFAPASKPWGRSHGGVSDSYPNFMLDLSPRSPLHFILSSSLSRSNFRFIVTVYFSLLFLPFLSRLSSFYTIPTAALQIYGLHVQPKSTLDSYYYFPLSGLFHSHLITVYAKYSIRHHEVFSCFRCACCPAVCFGRVDLRTYCRKKWTYSRNRSAKKWT